MKRYFGWALVLIPVILFQFGCRSQSASLSYLALGDSYTIGESVDESQRWPIQLVHQLRIEGVKISDPKIIAKTGWTTTELKEAMSEAELDPPFELVSLLIGVNDQYDGLDFDKYPERFKLLLNRAVKLADGIPSHVVVVSIPDYSVTPFGEGKKPQQIRRELEQYNAVNQSIAESLGVQYVNITPGSRDAASNRNLIADDGLHPSGEMYADWVDKIVPVLLPEIKKWQASE